MVSVVNVGSFREFIEIQDYTSKINDNGFEEKGWITLHKKRASAKAPSLKKQEVFKNQGIEITLMMEFKFRYIEGISYGQRILWNGNQWDIKGIENPDGKKVYHQILCERVLDSGKIND